MFTYIRLKNFLSFGEVTFDFRKSSLPKNFIAIYGENGSGKSNFVKSIDFLCHSLLSFEKTKLSEKISEISEIKERDAISKIMNAFIEDVDFEKNLSSCKMINCEGPTEVEFGFMLNNQEGIYKLIFSDCLLNESLYYLKDKQRGDLYNISSDGNGNLDFKYWSKLFTNSEFKKEINTEINKYWGNHTFLSIILEQMKKYNVNYIKNGISKNVLEVVNMFFNITVIIKGKNTSKKFSLGKKQTNILENLKNGSVEKSLLPILEHSEIILREFFTQTYADIKDVVYEKEFVENRINYVLYVDKIIAGKVRRIEFEKESSGTQKILDIVKMILRLFSGEIVVFDEIDNGIHDILFEKIINSFIDEIKGQLIITTHNTMLLETLESKYAYVIRTDYSGNKEIKCLDEFKLQNNNNQRIKYLKGLFGGTPFVEYIDYDGIIDEIGFIKGEE